ncbi:hypothetical protein N8510_03375, partial [bacterium]|nr:hypothetical protein [bacterium]
DRSSGSKSEPVKGPPPLRKNKSDAVEPRPSIKPAPAKSAKVVAAKAPEDKKGASESESKSVNKSAGMPDFSVLEKLAEPQGKADGAALDAFFSNQNAPASGTPAPAINLNLSQPPKKAPPPKKKSKRGKPKGKASEGDDAAN